MFTTLVLLGLIALSAVVFVVFVGFRTPKSGAPLVAEEGYSPAAGLPGVDLLALAASLLERYGIAVENRVESGPNEITLHARSRDPLIGGSYIIVCHSSPPDGIVRSTRLLEFRDEVKATGATKGVFLTDGFFTSDARYLLEDAPVSLLNRHEVAALQSVASPKASPGPVGPDRVLPAARGS
jgi:restriction endonuclease